MSTILITVYDLNMAPIGDLTSPLMEAYADRHQLKFEKTTNLPTDVPASWNKLPLALDAFDRGYEQVIWMDADVCITNPLLTPYGFMCSGFHASIDWGEDATQPYHFSAGCFVINKNARHLFEWCIEHRDEYATGAFWEQTPLRLLMERGDKKMFTHPRRVLNSVPLRVHPKVVDPWQRGDFVAHLTMIPVADKVKLFRALRHDS